ncbi:MAG: 5-methylthioadenosine/S-adenosylhomocysteine nucleosidase [Anaerocolumna sp.]|jgi:adenosylhomocysteine nucleosidase|nr:5-methylthioadenosine/S-adenosylhomocysteine nucleosidase [Anaerocolumna sp.]
MKKIGIIGAMEEEVEQLKQKMNNVNVCSKASMDFYTGLLEGKECVIVRSGIGKVNASVCTQILIDNYDIKMVINTGIAGSLKSEINVGDIVISTDAMQHDVDVRGFGYDYGVIPQMETSIFKAEERITDLAYRISKNVCKDIETHLGRIVSGDQFISDKEKKEWISSQFGASCTEMEGGAIAQTAYLNQIPFLILRAISDKADGSAEVDYESFKAKAIEHGVDFVTEFVKAL